MTCALRLVAAAIGLACASSATTPESPGPLPPSPAWVTISAEELRAGYDAIWAVSDVHGRLQEFDDLLVAAGLATRDGAGRVAWNPARRRQLLVTVGDYIDGGPDSVGVVLRVRELSEQAAAAGSRIVALLGNHEAAFLAYPSTAERSVLKDAHRRAAELGLPPRSRPSGDQLSRTEFGRFLRSLPAAGFVGTWLFAHSGYLDTRDDPGAVRALFSGIASRWGSDDAGRYRALLDPWSILECHNWWTSRRRRSAMRRRLATLGLNGLVFGHDPDGLGVRRAIAIDSDGWLIKLDTGLKLGESRGMLLRCEVAKVLQGTGLAMTTQGKPSCEAMTPDGRFEVVPTAPWR